MFLKFESPHRQTVPTTLHRLFTWLPFMIGEEMIMWSSIGLLSVFLTLLLAIFVVKAQSSREPSLQEILLQSQIKIPIQNTQFTDNVTRIKRSEPKKLTFWQKLFEISPNRRLCFSRFCPNLLSTP
jgi:hypothetical protein